MLDVVRDSILAFLKDDVLTLSAALAFYTLLSFAPLIVLSVVLASFMGEGAQSALLDQVESVIGPAARDAASAIIASADSRPALGTWAGVAGAATALIGATTVFAQLESSLNLIFGVAAKPMNAVWGWVRRRVLSAGVILAIGFVLIASLFISAALGLLLPSGSLALDAVNQVVSAAIFAALFGSLFRYLPDARIPWRWALKGGLVTALLFALGKWIIGFYLARGDVGGAYGAAGSLAVLLVWVYYASAIVFYGAELTKTWLARRSIEVPILGSATRA